MEELDEEELVFFAVLEVLVVTFFGGLDATVDRELLVGLGGLDDTVDRELLVVGGGLLDVWLLFQVL